MSKHAVYPDDSPILSTVSAQLFAAATKPLSDFIAALRTYPAIRANGNNAQYIEGRIEALQEDLWHLLRQCTEIRQEVQSEIKRLGMTREQGAKIRASVKARQKFVDIADFYMPTARTNVSPLKRNQIFTRDNYSCRLCPNTYKDMRLEVDHWIPVNEGGSHYDENLVTLCKDCNRKKGGRRPDTAEPPPPFRFMIRQLAA